ncbi:MAG: hypothetical protein CMF22_10605 [Idiomarinaceae bacterium]|nr:hypothetical protein [Idiomarinaceae bacterium]MBG23891.1 hypothetical protein [Idiomarinaceae bacterium]|tara:strand:+ start:9691 stop:11421 length:1731 start_codon:yes stop_codon:yes gene_type:complete
MSYIDVLNDAASRADAASTKAEGASDLLFNIVNGPEETFVNTDNGPVPTAATAIANLQSQITAGTLAPISESVTLGSNQTNVTFNSVQTSGISVYIDEGSGAYRYFNFTVDGTNTITLGDTFASGTIVWGLSQEIGGEVSTAVQQTQVNAQLAEDWAIKLGDTVDGSEYSAKYHAQAAASSASSSATSASTSQDWAIKTSDTVDGSEYSAKYYSQTASGFADTASFNANVASNKASEADTFAQNADASATAAALSESAAETSENNAATSEANAATSANNALGSENAAATSASNAADSETSAANSASAASTSETNAANSASAAATSASNAATSENNASSSADLSEDWATKLGSTVDGVGYSAKYHANQSAISAGNASTSETNAANSANDAATSESNTFALYDQFDDRYLGSKSSDPSLDNDGNPLMVGALFWSTADNKLKIYDGDSWNAVDSYPINSNGGPDFAGMPSVGGDPIVESGSNSDGGWTRLADGSQVCYNSSLGTGTSQPQNWTFPIAFTGGYSVLGSVQSANPDSAIVMKVSGKNTTSVNLNWIWIQEGGISGLTVNIQSDVFVFGKWK